MSTSPPRNSSEFEALRKSQDVVLEFLGLGAGEALLKNDQQNFEKHPEGRIGAHSNLLLFISSWFTFLYSPPYYFLVLFNLLAIIDKQ